MEREERTAWLRHAIINGRTLEEIGEGLGISRQGADQVIRRHGLRKLFVESKKQASNLRKMKRWSSSEDSGWKMQIAKEMNHIGVKVEIVASRRGPVIKTRQGEEVIVKKVKNIFRGSGNAEYAYTCTSRPACGYVVVTEDGIRRYYAPGEHGVSVYIRKGEITNKQVAKSKRKYYPLTWHVVEGAPEIITDKEEAQGSNT